MPFVGERVTLTTSAGVLINPVNANLGDPILATVTNQDASASCYLGGSGVTSAAGYELKFGKSIDVAVPAGDILYGITASGTVRVDVLRARS